MLLRVLILLLSLTINFTLFSSVAIAEELLPSGTKIIMMPGGGAIVLQMPATLISLEEKETLVRNDELWEVDRKALVELNEKINALENRGVLDDREIELLKQAREIEEQRAAFYKEQLELREKMHADAEKRLLELLKETKPSFFQELINKGGWIGLMVTIGIIIGVGL